MKNPQRMLAVCLAAKLASLPVAAAAQESTGRTTPPVKSNTQTDKNVRCSIYVGFVQDYKEFSKMFRLFLERRPGFAFLQDGTPGYYFGRAKPTEVLMGDQRGWAIGIKDISIEDAEYLHPLMTSFFYGSPDIQRDYGANGRVWMLYGNRVVVFDGNENPNTEMDEPVYNPLPLTFGVQVGAFRNKANADARLFVARAVIDPRFRIVNADGFHKVRLMNLSASQAVENIDKARAAFGLKEAEVVVNGVTTPGQERMVRDIALKSR